MRASPLPHSRRPGLELLGVRVGREQPAVGADRLARVPVEHDLALPQEHGAVAQPLDRLRVV